MAYTTLKLPFQITEGAPTPPPSPILANVGAGPLLLLEPGHPANPWAGVPANGAAVPDLAAAWTAQTLGAAADPLAIVNSVAAGSAKARLERTSKGGLHLLQSQTAQDTAYQFLQAMLGARRDFVTANAAHTFYVSAWMRQTRAAGNATGVPVAGLRRGSAVSDYHAVVGILSSQPWSVPSATSAATRHGGGVLAASGAAMIAATAAVGAPSGAYTNATSIMTLGASTAAQVNVQPSFVLYRVYVEDLTVSGRSAAQVAQLDQADFTAQVLSPGGRYFGDAWTNPATALP